MIFFNAWASADRVTVGLVVGVGVLVGVGVGVGVAVGLAAVLPVFFPAVVPVVFPGAAVFFATVVCALFLFVTVTVQTYFFLPIFACTLALPTLFPLMVTPVFPFLLSATFFLPETTVHFTFFLLFFNFTFTVFPTATDTDFLFSLTCFLAASADCGTMTTVMANVNATASVFLTFFIVVPPCVMCKNCPSLMV